MLRACTVQYEDTQGNDHCVEVTAETLYEAVAQALALLKGDDWITEVGSAHRVIVRVQPPVIEHRVRISDFQRWLDSHAKSPAEMLLKERARAILQSPKSRTK